MILPIILGNLTSVEIQKRQETEAYHIEECNRKGPVSLNVAVE